ncbi:NifU family protein [Fulvivirgaceae bacterium BMA10]|uniref:NifU family protein n=1 Tax=Splendidivirga corallicola TaxID=3051826 RepID=A0ABT8KK23_9BACT|nr:NifU family protein [Fulvivirgaceae bacterium BMA10]
METYDKEAMYGRVVNLYLEANPNPNSLKFVANFMLVPEGKSYDFPDAESAKDAPLAQELFKFDYVKRVFYMSNFVTITKSDEREWDEIKTELKTFIKEYLEAEKPLFTESYEEKPVINQDDSEVEKKIKQILEEYIKPAVEQDGGAISFDSFNDGVVKVLLQGSCSGCPSSTVTLKAGIENLLKRMVPEVEAVEAEGI